jgi:hypothetical protein
MLLLIKRSSNIGQPIWLHSKNKVAISNTMYPFTWRYELNESLPFVFVSSHSMVVEAHVIVLLSVVNPEIEFRKTAFTLCFINLKIQWQHVCSRILWSIAIFRMTPTLLIVGEPGEETWNDSDVVLATTVVRMRQPCIPEWKTSVCKVSKRFRSSYFASLWCSFSPY